MSWLSRVAGLVLLAVSSSAGAHSEGEAGEDVYAMDCEHPPQNAVKALPEKVAHWARIMCLPTGHVLVQSSEVQWRYPGSFTSKVMFPARSQKDDNDGKPRYFTQVAVRELSAEEARTQHQRLLRENTLYADRLTDVASKGAPQAPQTIWEVVGTNNANVGYEIYFVQQAGASDILGMVCSPTCESHLTFIVIPYN